MEKTYTNWENQQKTWEPGVTGKCMYFVMANRRLEIGDGRFFHDACLFRGSMYDVQQVCKLLKAARPDWTDAIQPVTAPCIFDAAKGEYINVERWI